MNFKQSRDLYLKSIEYIKNESYIEALNALVKISSAFLFYKEPPFEKQAITSLAKKCCLELKRKNAFHDEIKVGYAVILRNEGEIEKSIHIFDEVLDNGLHKEALLEKAYSLELLGANQEAIELLQDGLNEFPFDKMILNNLATLYETEEEWQKALNYYNLALEIDNNGGISYYNKGRILFVLEQYNEALEHFNQALQFYDQNDYRIVDIYIFLGDTYYKLKQLMTAENYYLKVVELYPKRGEGYFSLAEFYFNIGKKDLAVHFINKAIQLSIPQTDYFFKKAFYLYELNQHSEAVETLEHAIEQFPYEVKLLDLLGEIAYSQGNINKAAEVYKERLKIEDNHEILYILAESHFQTKEYTEALHVINRFVIMNPDFTEAYILRAKINAVTGYLQLALSDLYLAQKLEEGHLYLNDSDLYYFENLMELKEFKDFLKQVSH